MLRSFLIYLGLTFISLSSIGIQSKRDSGFVLKGIIRGLPQNSKVHLVTIRPDATRLRDTFMSTIAKDGNFVFSGKIPGAYYYFIALDSTISHANKNLSNPLWLSNNRMNLKGSIEKIDSLSLTGSSAQVDYLSSIKAVKMFEETNDRKVITDFIDSHRNSLYLPHFLTRLRTFLGLDSMLYYFNMLSVDAKATPIGLKLQNELSFKSRHQDFFLRGPIGTTLPNFRIKSINGDSVYIHDLIGKQQLTLIDFWASWCVPCRKSNPDLQQAYNNHKSNGFEIIGVSIDASESDWKNAVEHDQTSWIHTIDKIDNASKDIFSFFGIPAYILVDQKANILKVSYRTMAFNPTEDQVVDISKLDSSIALFLKK